MELSAIVQLALAILPLVQNGVTEFVAWITSLRSVAMQSGEWTEEQESAFRAGLFAKTKDPAYQQDFPSQPPPSATPLKALPKSPSR